MDVNSVKAKYETIKKDLATAVEKNNGSINSLLSNKVFISFLNDLYGLVHDEKGGEIFSMFYEMFMTSFFLKTISNSCGNNKDADRMYNVVGAMKNNASQWPYMSQWQQEGKTKPWLQPWSVVSQLLADWETRFSNNPLANGTKKYEHWSEMSPEEQQAIINGFLAKATQNAFDKTNGLRKNLEASISNDSEFNDILTNQFESIFNNELHMKMDQKNLVDMLGSLGDYYGKDDENKELVSNINFVKDIVANYGKNLKALNKSDDNIEDFANGGAPTNNVKSDKSDKSQSEESSNDDGTNSSQQ